ncbi:MAG TPA: type II toxin-antitoxin system Phd/YefM family antitoxin [Tepidisphaeraceae bacterium]|jgi:PHD/YefM family antitoxin component YafN of YafNO toxin-antitoxin module
MKLSIVTFRKNMADPINRVAYSGERLVLERRGKGVAALVSMEDLAALEAMEDAADIRAARKALKERGSIPWQQVKTELGIAPATPPTRGAEKVTHVDRSRKGDARR